MTDPQFGVATRFARHTTVTVLSAVATALALVTPPELATSEPNPAVGRGIEPPALAVLGGPSSLAQWIDLERRPGEQRFTAELSTEPWLARSAQTLAPVLDLFPGWPSPRAPLPHPGDHTEDPTTGGPSWLVEAAMDDPAAALVLADALESNQPRVVELAARLPPDLTRPLFQFRWPLQGEITTYFAEIDPLSPHGHAGLDIANVWGSPVRAVEEGRVRTVALDNAYGWHIVVDHGNAFTSLYAHLSDYDVDEGQWVARGERIGFVGSTGFSTGPHLHLELRQNGILQDPLAYLP